jgi:succinate-semialdehyde dehydrogenase/glutarate-semialdehyde dehydrogenase
MKRLASYDPSNGDLLGEVTVAGTGQIGEIVNSALVASKSWRQLKTADRVQILARAYAQLESHFERLTQLLSREMGKDIRRASGEVSGVVHGGPYIAEDAMRALQSKDLGGGSRLEYKPLGVAAVIAPWNYPLAMANNLIVPALVAGNGVVFKPSEETPLIAQEFAEILNQVLPPDLLQIVHGDGEQGQALVEGEVDMIAFTGSQAVGRQIMAHAAGRLKRLVMELGGNDPMIVMADADIEHAARFAVASSFENAGQMCISTERIYVDETVAERFEQRVVEFARQYQIGPWNQPDVNIGPIINAKQHGKILEHIRDAEAKGARVLLGGSEQPERYITPTVICDISPDMLLEQDETFGPVVAIGRYRSIEQAIERANDTNYGLGAVVFGGSQAATVADRMEAGMIGVNQGVGGAGEAPWVGAKQSGFGFHGSPAGHRQFAQVRVLSS